MDIGLVINKSFAYAKEGLLGNLSTWVLLIILALLPAIPFILAIIFMLPVLMTGTLPDIATLIGVFGVAFIVAVILSAFCQGYLIKIFRGETPLPAVSGYSAMFTDGIKYIVIEIIYFIPVIVFLAITLGYAFMAAMSIGPSLDALLPIIISVLVSVLVALVIAFILFLFAVIGVIRFARTGSIGEAFNFSAIVATIRSIGWGSYILALVIGIAIIVIVQMILGIIPYIGWLLQVIISPFISVFFTRYLTIMYESSEPAVQIPVPAPGQE
jgi:hypothetical protein